MSLIGAELRIVHWGARAVARPLRDHLVPVALVWMLVVVQADVVIDWAALSSALEALPPWVAGATLAALAFVHAVSQRRAVADLLLGRRLEILHRQPVPDWMFGPPAAMLLTILALPLGGIAVAWYGPHQPAAVGLWMGLSLVPLLLQGAGATASSLGACGVAGGVAAWGQAVPAAQPGLALLTWVVVVPWLGAGTRQFAREGGRSRRRLGLRGRGAWSALVGRDLRALARCDPGILRGLVGLAGGLALVLYAVRVNNDLAGLPMSRAALVGVAATGPLVLQGLVGAARRLGSMFDPPQWPVTPSLRAASLLGTSALLWVPAWAGAAVGGAGGLGVVEHLRIACFVLAGAAGAAWFVARRPRVPDHGLFPWWIGGCLALSFVGPWWGPLSAAGIGGAALILASRALRLRRSQR